MSTKRRYQILNYIKDHVNRYGYMPTTKISCYDLKIGRGSFQRILNYWVDEGKLTKLPYQTINYKIVDKPNE